MVYFIQGKNKVKIGHSDYPSRRLKQLKANSPIELKIIGTLSGSAKTEKSLHEIFFKYHSHNEWFEYKGFLKECIIALNENYRDVKTLPDFLKSGHELRVRKAANRKSKRGKSKLKNIINQYD